MAATEDEAKRVKDKYSAEWRKTPSWHSVGVNRDTQGHYVGIGVDPGQPLPSPQTVEGVRVVFQHMARFKAQ